MSWKNGHQDPNILSVSHPRESHHSKSGGQVDNVSPQLSNTLTYDLAFLTGTWIQNTNTEVILFPGTKSFGSELGGEGALFLAAAVWDGFIASPNWEK